MRTIYLLIVVCLLFACKKKEEVQPAPQPIQYRVIQLYTDAQEGKVWITDYNNNIVDSFKLTAHYADTIMYRNVRVGFVYNWDIEPSVFIQISDSVNHSAYGWSFDSLIWKGSEKIR